MQTFRRTLDRARYGHDMKISIEQLRRYAVARSLFRPATSRPRHRAAGVRAGRSDSRTGARAGPHAGSPRGDYRAGDLDAGIRGRGSRRTSSSTTGSCPPRTGRLMHPRIARRAWTAHAAGRRRRSGTSSGHAVRCIRAPSTPTSRTAGRPTGSVARRTQHAAARRHALPPAACGSSAATAEPGCMPFDGDLGGGRGRCHRVERLDALVDIVVASMRPCPPRASATC